MHTNGGRRPPTLRFMNDRRAGTRAHHCCAKRTPHRCNAACALWTNAGTSARRRTLASTAASAPTAAPRARHGRQVVDDARRHERMRLRQHGQHERAHPGTGFGVSSSRVGVFVCAEVRSLPRMHGPQIARPLTWSSTNTCGFGRACRCATFPPPSTTGVWPAPSIGARGRLARWNREGTADAAYASPTAHVMHARADWWVQVQQPVS